MAPRGDCAYPEDCAADGACFWRRYVASLSPDERAVMDELDAIIAPEDDEQE